MHGISGIIYIILAACLLPYVFTGIAKMAGGFKARDNQNPREFLAQTKGVAAGPMRHSRTVLRVYRFYCGSVNGRVHGRTTGHYYDLRFGLSGVTGHLWYLLPPIWPCYARSSGAFHYSVQYFC